MDIPSLFMIPSAVSSGKVHSVFPNSTDADFDFNRDSDATRVNSEGLIERVGYYGSELVTNGDFSTNSDWTLSNSVIENGVLKLNGQSGTVRARQNISFTGVAKITYTISFNNTSNTTMQLRDFSGANTETIPATVGTHTVFRNFATTGITLQTPPVVGAEIHLDNVSVKEVTGDRARLNYEIEGGLVNTKPSLLLEPQSSNLITYSEDFSQWDSIGSTQTSTPNLNPIDSTAYKIESTVNTSSRIFISGIMTSTNTYSSSYLVKATSNSPQYLGFACISNTVPDVLYNFANDQFEDNTISGNAAKCEIISMANDWKLLKVPVHSSVTNTRLNIYQGSKSGNQLVGTIGQSYFIKLAQLEELSYCTSYIPTNGSAQTRAAETCNGAGTSSILPSEEGILYCEIAALADDSTNRLFSLSNGTSQNRIFLGFNSSSNSIRYRVQVANVYQADNSVPVSDITLFNKIAFKYKANDFALWINGSQVDTDASGTTFSAGTLSELDFDSAAGGSAVYGKIRDIRVYNTKEMTDSEVDILLTKITS